MVGSAASRPALTPLPPSPTPPTPPAAILCFMVGPLGLLCHLATKWAVRRWRGRGQKDDYVVYRF